MFVLGTMRDQTTVSLCVFCQQGKGNIKKLLLREMKLWLQLGKS